MTDWFTVDSLNARINVMLNSDDKTKKVHRITYLIRNAVDQNTKLHFGKSFCNYE